MFVLVSVIGGVLAAGLMVPTAGIAAESAKSIGVALNSLPQQLKVDPPTEGSTVLMGDGTVLTTFFDQNRKNITLDQIAPIMRQAQVAVEDQRFYSHGALDFRGTLRALVRNSSGNAQGGSTLTQQYVKLALLYDAAARNDVKGIEAANSRTVSRKILELRYAISLEKTLTKDQILERYLNISYFGDKAYGIEAAAQHYFGVAAKDLTLPQAAMLAGIVRNPVTTNPVKNVAAATERMRNVLDVMAEQKLITAKEAAEAKAYKFDATKVVTTPSRGCSGSRYPHLCDYVTQVLLKQTPSLGENQSERLNTLNQAGLTIQTMIDPRFQDAAQASVSNFVAPTDPVIAMMNLIQPGTGLILGMAQSRVELGPNTEQGQTYLNYAASNALNGSGGREGGSTFKAFTLTAAILAGVDPINDYTRAPLDVFFDNGTNFGGCAGGKNTTATIHQSGGGWPVHQSGRTGDFNMYMGATYSSNTYFTQLEKQVGVCNVVKAAEALGLKRADGANLLTGILPNGKLVPGFIDGEKPTFTLGNTPVEPLSLASAYATLAARGVRCDPIILKAITDTKDRTYAVPSANCSQVIPADVADRVNDILHGPFSSEGTAEKAMIPGYLVSGKTGTQTDAPTILTNGYTPDVVGSAILSVDQKDARAKAARPNGVDVTPLAGFAVHGSDIEVSDGPGASDYYHPGSSYTLKGGSGPEAGGSIWRPTMLKVLPLLPHTEFVRPTDSPYSGADTNAGISWMMRNGQVPTAGNPMRGGGNQGNQTTDAPPQTSTQPATTTTQPATSTQPATTTTTRGRKPVPTPTP
jgi:membrane peptidoglycan carboxypeptidase